jgi:hypothetical protein
MIKTDHKNEHDKNLAMFLAINTEEKALRHELIEK